MFRQNYIKPIWFGPSEEQRRTEALMKSTAELQTSIGAVVTNLQEMQASLTKQQENINQVILNTNAQRVSHGSNGLPHSHYTGLTLSLHGPYIALMLSLHDPYIALTWPSCCPGISGSSGDGSHAAAAVRLRDQRGN